MRPILRRIAVPLLLAAFLATANAGCFYHSYGAPAQQVTGLEISKWDHYFLFGLIPLDPNVDPNAMCHGPPARVATWLSPLGAIIGVITLGIYVPTQTSVWCK